MKLLLLPALACARTFVDDEGTVFTTDGTPTIITAASDALSLEHIASDRHLRRALHVWI